MKCIKNNKMKLFIYKTLFLFIFIFILFQLTFGLAVKEIKKNLVNLGSKEYSETIKIKIREEIKSGLGKDQILKKEDAVLIKRFLNKISNEIKQIN
jgi:hypothetical protein|tara:strand:- start:247 stop:534 length:288 start_codon:yes stop_codon:yes gene_type:complete